MPLGDILAAQSDGQGGFRTPEPFLRAPAPQAVPIADPPDLGDRVRIIQTVTNNTIDPQDAMAFARLQVPTEMLPQTYLNAAGVKDIAEQVAILGSLSPQEQKQVWEKLPERGQSYWRNNGWDPGADSGGGFMSSVFGGIGIAKNVVEAPIRYPYRAAQHIPLVGGAVEPVVHNTVGQAAHYGVGAPVHAALEGYNKVAAVPSHIYRAGTARTGVDNLLDPFNALVHGDLDAAFGAPKGAPGVKDAWARTADGERYIKPQARERALDQIGGDQDLYDVLLSRQAGDELEEIVTRRYGFEPGSEEYQGTLVDLNRRVKMPDALAAMKELRQGKVSFGRDLARTAGLSEGSTGFTLVSGVGDGLWSWYTDPTLLGGKALHASRVARFGITAENAEVRTIQMLGHRLVEDPVTGAHGVMKIASADRATNRAVEFIAEKWTTGKTAELMDRFPQQGPMFEHLHRFADNIGGIKSADDVRAFFLAKESQTLIASGELTNLTRRVRTLPRLTRVEMATGEVKDLLRSTIDWSVDNRATNLAARVGAPMAGFLKAFTSHVPRETYLDLRGPSGIAEVKRLMGLYQYAGVPTSVQHELFDFYLKGSTATRRNIYLQTLHDISEGMGINSKRMLDGVADKQIYSAFGHDIHNGAHVGLLPAADTSSYIYMPSFRELLRHSALEHVIPRFFGKASAGKAADLTLRYWAPSTLLRLAFIPRVVGDEALGFILRHGPSTYLKGLATPFAYDAANLTHVAFDPIAWMGRTIAKPIPSRLLTGTREQAIGYWWDDMQRAMAKHLGGASRLTEKYVGTDRVVAYALKHGDPLRRFPEAMARNSVMATTYARHLAGRGAFWERDNSAEAAEALFVRGMRGDEWIASPVAVGGEFERVASDAVLGGEKVYLGSAPDSDVVSSAARRMNYMLSDPAMQAFAHEARAHVGDQDYDGLLDALGGKPIKPKNQRPYQEVLSEAEARRDDLAAVDYAARDAAEAAGQTVSGGPFSEWQMSDEYWAAHDEARRIRDLGPRDYAPKQPPSKGEKKLDEMAKTYHYLDPKMQRDLAEAIRRNEPAEFDALLERWGMEGKGGKFRSRLVNDMKKLDARQRNIVVAWAGTTAKEIPEVAFTPGVNEYLTDLLSGLKDKSFKTLPVEVARALQGKTADADLVGRIEVYLRNRFDAGLSNDYEDKIRYAVDTVKRAKTSDLRSAGIEFKGLRKASPEYLDEALRQRIRRHLDTPSLQPDLMGMSIYGDVAQKIPTGHVQVYGIAATPEEMTMLREAYRVLGPDLFKATPDMPDAVANALGQLRQGFASPDLLALQDRKLAMGAGKIPVASWSTIDADVAQQVRMALRRNVTGVAAESELAAGAFSVGYMHVPEEVLTNRVFLDGKPPAFGAADAGAIARDGSIAPWSRNDEFDRLEALRIHRPSPASPGGQAGFEEPFTAFAHGDQKRLLGPENEGLRRTYASHNPWEQQREAFDALFASGVTETPEYRAAMDAALADMGLPEEFTVFRGNRRGMFGKHDYVNVSLDPRTAAQFGTDWGTPAAFKVKRSEIRLVAYPGEEELLLPRSALTWESGERATAAGDSIADDFLEIMREADHYVPGGVGEPTKHLAERMQMNNRALQEGGLDVSPEMAAEFNQMLEQAPDWIRQAVRPVATRSAYAPKSWLLGNVHLDKMDDYANWTGRTLEEAKDDHALRLKNEGRDTFTKDGRIFHELLNPGIDSEIDFRHILSMPDGIPTETIQPRTRVVTMNAWDNVVRFGFDRVVGPAVDSLIRQPMYLHFATEAFKEAEHVRPLLTNKAIVERADTIARGVGAEADDLASIFEHNPALRKRLGDISDHDEWVKQLDRYVEQEKKRIQEMIDDFGDQPDFGSMADTRVRKMSPKGKAAMPRRSDGLEVEMDDLDAAAATLRQVSPDDARSLADYAKHRAHVDDQLTQIAASRAVGEMMPIIDDHRIRSQFQEFIKPFVPFWFAQEQFLKRWGRLLAFQPEALAKAALTFQGLREVGLVTKNQYGDDVYVVPGSAQFIDLAFKVAGPLLGTEGVVPIQGSLTGSIKYSVPGFDLSGNPIQPGPLVGLPLRGLSSLFPEFKPLEAKVMGGFRTQQGVLSMVVPAHVRRFYDAAVADPSGARMSNAMMQAAAQLEAGGHGIPDNATQTDIDVFRDRVRSHARVILIAQAILGFITPATPQMEYDGDLQPEYQELLNSGLPIEEAHALFVAAHPDADAFTVFKTRVPGKATLPAGKDALAFLDANADALSHYRRGGAWLLPQSDDPDEFVQAAYQQQLATGIRQRKTFDEWYADVKFSESASTYYDSKRQYENALAGKADSGSRRKLTDAWETWKDSYFQMHPLFGRMISQRSDQARIDRAETRAELARALTDSDLPVTEQTPHLQAMVRSFDSFTRAMNAVGTDQRAGTTKRRKALRVGFANWGDSYAAENPQVRAFWQRVIRPDIGLTETEA